MKDRTILSLYDYSGNWSQPYREAGYNVIQVDIQHGQDARFVKYLGKLHGILAAPPCTKFAYVGAQHWPKCTDADLAEALWLADVVARFVTFGKPEWWALENPRGRLRDYIGEPHFKFQPNDFGDPWSKATWLWGDFTPPFNTPIEYDITQEPGRPGARDRTARLSGGNKNKRTATPPGFCKAFYLANP